MVSRIKPEKQYILSHCNKQEGHFYEIKVKEKKKISIKFWKSSWMSNLESRIEVQNPDIVGETSMKNSFILLFPILPWNTLNLFFNTEMLKV